MNPQRIKAYLRKDGWLLAVMALAALLCLALGAMEERAPAQTQDEQRLERVLSAMAGAGSVSVAIHYDGDALPCGAVIVAQGAQDAAVRIRLSGAVTTLLGLEADRVAVYPSETGGSP